MGRPDERCRQFDEMITDYALSDQSGISAKNRETLDAHLAVCPRCREELRLTQKLIDALRCDGIDVPEWVIRETDEKVKKAIREFCEESTKKEQVHSGRLLWVPIGAMAAFILISLWAAAERHWAREQSPPSAKSPVVVAKETGTSQSTVSGEWQAIHERQFKWQKTFEAAQTPAEALKILQDCLAEAKAKEPYDPEGFLRTIGLCDKLVAKWPDSREALDARKLICDCYTAMAETEKARAAFLAYAEAVGARAKKEAMRQGLEENAAEAQGREATSREIYLQGYELFGGKDYAGAIYYFDVVQTRYPLGETANKAEYVRGRVYAALGNADAAIKAYRKVIQASKDEDVLANAYLELSQDLFNAARQDEAIKVLEEQAKRMTSNEVKALALFRAAVLQRVRGEGFLPDALAKLKEIVERYPDAQYARAARGQIAEINKEMAGALGRQ